MIISLILLTACAPLDSDDSYGDYDHRDCRYYGNCNHDDSHWDRRPYDRYPNRRDPYYNDHDHNDYRKPPRYDNHNDDHDSNDDNHYRKPNQVQRVPNRDQNRIPTNNDIKPNCPAGTRYDGSHCKITDQKLRKPGGDGNINPCPKGMWVSSGKCVGK